MAAPLYAEFIVDFPEFDQIAQAYIEVKLAEAEAMLDAEAFGAALYNIGVGYKAAHLLALSPYGQQLQLVNDQTGESVYSTAFTTQILPLCARRGLLL